MTDVENLYLSFDGAMSLLASLVHTKHFDRIMGDEEVEWLATRTDGSLYVVATGTFYGSTGIVCIDPYDDRAWGQFSGEQAYELLDKCTPPEQLVPTGQISRQSENILVVGMYRHWREDCIKYIRPQGAKIIELDTPDEASEHWRDQLNGMRPRIRCVVLADAISCGRDALTVGARGPQPGFQFKKIGRVIRFSDYLSGKALSGPLGEIMQDNFLRRRITRNPE